MLWCLEKVCFDEMLALDLSSCNILYNTLWNKMFPKRLSLKYVYFRYKALLRLTCNKMTILKTCLLTSLFQWSISQCSLCPRVCWMLLLGAGTPSVRKRIIIVANNYCRLITNFTYKVLLIIHLIAFSKETVKNRSLPLKHVIFLFRAQI